MCTFLFANDKSYKKTIKQFITYPSSFHHPSLNFTLIMIDFLHHFLSSFCHQKIYITYYPAYFNNNSNSMIDHIIFFRKGLIVWPTYLIHVACHFTHKFLRDFTSQPEDLLLPRKKTWTFLHSIFSTIYTFSNRFCNWYSVAYSNNLSFFTHELHP